MKNFWVICILLWFGNKINGEVIKFGQLVNQNGSWEQNGVVLLPYRVNFNGNLVKIRAGFRNTNPIYIQVWSWVGKVNKTYQFQLNSQRRYSAINTGVETVDFSEDRMKISEGEHIGVFFPQGMESALVFQQVYPAYPLNGSEYLPGVQNLPIGQKILFGPIGYINRLSIEFYVESDGPITTTTTTTTSLSPTTTIVTTKTTAESSSHLTDTYVVTGRSTTKALGQGNLSDKPLEAKSTKTIIISVVAVIGLVLLFAIVLGCILVWRKRRQSRHSHTPFVQTSNPIYSTTLAGTGFEQGQKKPKEVNIYETINSDIFTINDEAIKKTH